MTGAREGLVMLARFRFGVNSLTLVHSQSALRTMVVTLPVATPPLLEICGANRTKLTEWCQGCGH